MPKWEVVGGADKGGILVRKGLQGESPQEEERLSTGAIVEQIELVGVRLNYKVLTGTGPPTGWVSIKLKDKDLLVPVEDKPEPKEAKDWPGLIKSALTGPSGGPGTMKEASPVLSGVGKSPPEPKVRLVLFTWTGNRGGAGSAHAFLKWPKILDPLCPGVFQVTQINYAGRGSRMKEPNATSASEVAKACADAIKKAGSPMPTVLFGFSFGAILAYEVATILAERGVPLLGLVVASAEHPGFEGRKKGVGAGDGPTKDTSDDEFKGVLHAKGGTEVILSNPDMAKMYLPVIRADMVMEEAYGMEPPSHPELPCPIVVFRGKECPIISRADVDPWLELTGCKDGTPTRVEELATGLTPNEMGPWLSDWYLCQGEPSAEAMLRAIAKDFGGAQ